MLFCDECGRLRHCGYNSWSHGREALDGIAWHLALETTTCEMESARGVRHTVVTRQSDARLRLVQPLKCRPDLLDQVGRRRGPAPLAEGLGGARAGQAARGPPGEHPRRARAARRRVGALGLEARRPVHEDSQRAGEQVALPAASGKREASSYLQ